MSVAAWSPQPEMMVSELSGWWSPCVVPCSAYICSKKIAWGCIRQWSNIYQPSFVTWKWSHNSSLGEFHRSCCLIKLFWRQASFVLFCSARRDIPVWASGLGLGRRWHRLDDVQMTDKCLHKCVFLVKAFFVNTYIHTANTLCYCVAVQILQIIHTWLSCVSISWSVRFIELHRLQAVWGWPAMLTVHDPQPWYFTHHNSRWTCKYWMWWFWRWARHGDFGQSCGSVWIGVGGSTTWGVGLEVNGSHGIRAWWCSISSAGYKGCICTRKSWIYTKQGVHSLSRTILVRMNRVM